LQGPANPAVALHLRLVRVDFGFQSHLLCMYQAQMGI
jgi:hypothetical protein